MEQYEVVPLPLEIDFETPVVLRKLASTHRYLAELKGVARIIPDETILINTLSIQEAKDSSEVESIITTSDELYKAGLSSELIENPATKEVHNYARALLKGFDFVKEQKLLNNRVIKEIQAELIGNSAGFRTQAGTNIVNAKTGEVIYSPPQDYEKVVYLMGNLEYFINDDSLTDLDALVKMAVIHFQFESIHPFYDGNGRAGRIINILYLALNGLLDLPILYLSRYIIQNKTDYYRLLQEVRVNGDWESWIFYMLHAIEETSKQTIVLIEKINEAMNEQKAEILQKCPKIYSHELLINIFSHPYTKIEFVMNDLDVSRITATDYLNQLAEKGILDRQGLGRSNFYINRSLFAILNGRKRHLEKNIPVKSLNVEVVWEWDEGFAQNEIDQIFECSELGNSTILLRSCNSDLVYKTYNRWQNPLSIVISKEMRKFSEFGKRKTHKYKDMDWSYAILLANKMKQFYISKKAYFAFLLGHDLGYCKILQESKGLFVISEYIKEFAHNHPSHKIDTSWGFPIERVCDQIGLYIVEKIYSKEQFYKEIKENQKIKRVQREYLHSIHPSLDTSNLQNETTHIVSHCKNEFLDWVKKMGEEHEYFRLVDPKDFL